MIKDPHSEFNKLNQNIFLFGAKFISKVPTLAYLAENFGKSLEILRIYKAKDISKRSFVRKHFFGLRREYVWDNALKQLENSPWVGFEFGVAWGFSSKYHLDRGKKLKEWHGFDTFTGLPENWRHYKSGHFSNDGKFPEINDKRVQWHKGLVQQTVNSIFFESYANQKKYIILDLDLFEPTFWVLSKISPFLKPDDLLYFDEPHDIDEGSLLHIFCKLNTNKYEVILSSPCQVLIKILRKGIYFPSMDNVNI